MDRRFSIFAILVAIIFVGNQVIYNRFFAPPPVVAEAKADPKKPAAAKDPAKAPGVAAPADAEKPVAEKPAAETGAAQPPDNAKPAQAVLQAPEAAPPDAAAAEQAAPVAQRWLSLGSADPAQPYRMLVTLNNRGAAVERIELSSPRYRDLEDRSGYLGHISAANAPQQGGAEVRVVGPGTPAARAGLKTGDVITAVGETKIKTAAELVAALAESKRDQQVILSVTREGATQRLTADLGWRPLEVIRPELDTKPLAVVEPKNHDPLSFLLTLQQVGESSLDGVKPELPGVSLLDATWNVIDRKRLAEELPGIKTEGAEQDEAIFFSSLPKLGVKVAKIYRLRQVPADQLENPDYPAYDLTLDVVLGNAASEARKLAYRLDGPTGLPTEGSWYANKVSQGSFFSSAGLRDVMVHFEGGQLQQISPMQLADPEFATSWSESPLNYIADDAQYFAAAMIPQKRSPTDVWYTVVKPTRVGALPEDKNNNKLINVSFRLEGRGVEVEPGGQLSHRYQIFAGPKRPNLLAEYVAPGTEISLGELVYYGWFGIVARPMLVLLHGFYSVIGNYGLAIIMLTVLVRGCMFPLSRKQALATQKMQLLQPEMKRINEKHKSEPEKKTKATQDLFRQHNYNPLGGCMLALVQLPIFMGLYRSLMVDVELRQAPLFGDAIRWASNLAAPDMFWDWSHLVPDFISHGTGFFGLGPYLNIFPLVTVALFIWQQKMFMPPAADEQAAMQQKMMQYMTLFMGIMFFKVASGLCVYFIASSIWGIAERKLLPKTLGKNAATPGGAVVTAAPATSNGSPSNGKKRQRGRK